VFYFILYLLNIYNRYIYTLLFIAYTHVAHLTYINRTKSVENKEKKISKKIQNYERVTTFPFARLCQTKTRVYFTLYRYNIGYPDSVRVCLYRYPCVGAMIVCPLRVDNRKQNRRYSRAQSQRIRYYYRYAKL
jgi:hypothetical protein